MTNERIAELRKLCEAATPPPWESVDSVGAGLEMRGSVHLSEGVELPPGMPPRPIKIIEGATPQKVLLAYERWVQFEPTGWSEMQDANFAFIAASRNALPEILDALEAAQRERDAALATVAEMRAAHTAQLESIIEELGAIPTEGIFDVVCRFCGKSANTWPEVSHGGMCRIAQLKEPPHGN